MRAVGDGGPASALTRRFGNGATQNGSPSSTSTRHGRATYSERGKDRSAERHYSTMTIEQIRALRLPAADDCVIYCGRTAPHAALAHSCLEAWGFTDYCSEHVWGKVSAAGGARRHGPLEPQRA